MEADRRGAPREACPEPGGMMPVCTVCHGEGDWQGPFVCPPCDEARAAAWLAGQPKRRSGAPDRECKQMSTDEPSAASPPREPCARPRARGRED